MYKCHPLLIGTKENADMDIGRILSRAWEILWKHKVLWIFGIFAGCASTSGGPGNASYTWQTESPKAFEQFSRGFQEIPPAVLATGAILLILGVLLLIVLAIFLGTIGNIGIIKATSQAEEGQEEFTFGGVFNDSLPYFWRVFLLNLLVGVAAFLAILLFIILGVIGSIVTLGIGALCFVPLLCLLAPLGWLLNIFVQQSSIAIVVENLGIMDGLERGWEVFKANLGYMIVMGLILFLGVGLIGGFIISLPVGIIVIPAIFGTVLGGASTGAGLMVAGLCFVLYLPVFIVLNGLLRGYIQASWTLTFLQATDSSQELMEVSEASV
jgi:hypothetical protein